MKPDNIKRRTAPRGPKGHCGNWERHQTVRARELKMKIRHVRKRIDRYVKRHPEHMRLKTVLPLGITMKRYGFSIRRMIGELHYRRGSRREVGLKHVPSKSWLHKWPGRLPADLLDDLIRFTAGEAVYGTFSADSTHRRFNRYVLIDYTKNGKARGQKAGKNDAPEGKRWIANTCKHHALISPDGTVQASIVTDRDTADSTIFAKLCAKLPKGRGVALGDGAYCSSDNCEAAVATGRDPFFEPKKNHTGKGTDTCRDGQVLEGTPGPVLRSLQDQDHNRGRILCHQAALLCPVRDPPHAGTRACNRLNMPQYRGLTAPGE